MKKGILGFVVLVTLLLTTQSGIALVKNNPLLINGEPINYEQFSLSSKGMLRMVVEDTNGKGNIVIPFRIYLKRDNKIVHLGSSNANNKLTEIEISQVLKFANLGDELVIEPVDKKFYTAKRVFLLRNNLVKFMSKFLFNKNSEEGC